MKKHDAFHLYSYITQDDDIHVDIMKIAEIITKYGDFTTIFKFGNDYKKESIHSLIADEIIRRGKISYMIEGAFRLFYARNKLLKAIVATRDTITIFHTIYTFKKDYACEFTPEQEEILYHGIIDNRDVDTAILYAKLIQSPCLPIQDFILECGSSSDVLRFAQEVTWSDKQKIEHCLIDKGEMRHLGAFAKQFPKANKKKIAERIKAIRRAKEIEYRLAIKNCR